LGNLNRALLLGGTLHRRRCWCFMAPSMATEVSAGSCDLPFLAGILWIGLLYYFNFDCRPTMPRCPPSWKPAVFKYIAPSAVLVPLGGDRHIARAGDHGACSSILSRRSHLPGLPVDRPRHVASIIMAANVRMFIWPARRSPSASRRHCRSDRCRQEAMLFRRTNFVLSDAVRGDAIRPDRLVARATRLAGDAFSDACICLAHATGACGLEMIALQRAGSGLSGSR
jgi:hypothetical protein